MRKGLSLAVGATLLLGSSGVFAQDSVKTAPDTAPWHVARVSKSSQMRSVVPSPQGSIPRYLHIELEFNVPPGQRKMHELRVTDRHGETISQIEGWDREKGGSPAVFQGNWGSLVGLYLDGLGHREPLFAVRPVAPRAVETRPPTPRALTPSAAPPTRIVRRYDPVRILREKGERVTRVVERPEGIRHIYMQGSRAGTQYYYIQRPDGVVVHPGTGRVIVRTSAGRAAQRTIASRWLVWLAK